ncbi:hypothetical protein PPSIR1_39965 [Plesiocystis pacifica SIR-1]|uniref:DUF4398 domain-containing protein n=1 Tax=Plesiocystis pacifica SIR-1 TaxID=391625 RepID=A6FYC3_9BACT|nr:hypothetical protein [Plesiocystis pacifica]EDM81502.1 hypothetical protein PPSIR1_39965 [Plesiocystis pacifica SIR-1]
MRRPLPWTRLAPALLALALTSACMENGNDYYAEGLRLLGEAERGACDLGFDAASGQAVINASRISTCLEKTKEGLAQLEKAKELGVDHRESNELLEKTRAEVAQMESMLKMVSRMENTQHLD